MPRYECPRCGSERAFFQSENDIQNGLEMYTDINGKTQFRNSLRVSSVQTPYCHDCIVVKMNSYRTAEETKRRYLAILASVVLGLLVFFYFFYSNGSSNTASNLDQNGNQQSQNESASAPGVTPGFYISDYMEDGSQLVNRDLVSTGIGNCGGMLYDSVQEANQLVPGDWLLAEFNGCGSGSRYRWYEEADPLKYVELEFHADAGWCVDLAPSQRSQAVGDRVLNQGESLVQISPSESSAIARYIYIKSSPSLSQNIIGVIEIGSETEFCGWGDWSLESPLVESNDLYKELASLLFG
jgi:hypothetical protein